MFSIRTALPCKRAVLLLVATVITLSVSLADPAAADRAAAQASALDELGWWENARSHKCLDQSWSGGTAHPEVLAITCNGGDNQLWVRREIGNHYRMFNWRSLNCLDQSWAGGSEHREIVVVTCNYGQNQDWFVFNFNTPAGAYSHSRVQNVLSGKYLDQDYTDNVEHRDVIAYPYKATAQNQAWIWHFVAYVIVQ